MAAPASPKNRSSSAPVPIEDPLEARRYLERSIELGCKSILQVKGDERRFQVRISGASSPEAGLVLIPDATVDLDEFELALKASGGDQCLVLVFLPGAAILGISAKYAETGTKPGERRRGDRAEKRMLFDYPTRVFRIQRRKEARLDIPAGYDLSIDIPSPENPKARLQKRLLDLSANGLAFKVLSAREASFYKTDVMLKDAVLVLQGRKMRMDLRIRNQIRMAAEGAAHGHEAGVKIGASFNPISREDAEFIMVYVTSRLSHKML